MNTINELAKLINSITELKISLTRDYKPKEIKALFIKSGLNIEDVALGMYRSYARARHYCRGERMSKRIRIDVANFFIGKINEKTN